MGKDLLFEIGMEEIPARFVRAAVEQLGDKTGHWLAGAHIAYGAIELFATPRRIAVLVHDVAEKQSDINEEVKGPSQKIAEDESGAWSKAALGFARSQGVEPGELIYKEINGVQYVHAVKSSRGVETMSLLSAGLSDVVGALHFPKNMRWGQYDFKFIRPIRWLVALFGAEVIPLQITGVDAGRTTRGHRFLGQDVALNCAGDYEQSLRQQFVCVSISERQNSIIAQIQQLAEQKSWVIDMKADLLEEVLFLVEFPTVLFGSFAAVFLQIPEDVLITSMREHQRYFPVHDGDGKLLPYFVTVRNGNADHLELVARGNEKVLRARLADARFFYEEDQKLAIDKAVQRLETIVYHEDLGSMGDKVRRIGAISQQLAVLLKLDARTTDHIARTAAICKFDLITQMVGEFPELQGIMGCDYALKANEDVQVAQAVKEHYQPRFSADASPASMVGVVVSIADKIDAIVGCFAQGILPTGSQDPYALRRQAAGIVQIILDHKLPLKLTELFTIAIQTLAKAGLLKQRAGEKRVSEDSDDEIKQALLDFFALRVRNVLTEQSTHYDIIEAVMAAGFDDVNVVVRKASALMSFAQSDIYKETLESFNRVGNLSLKAESAKINVALLIESSEEQLYHNWLAVHGLYAKQLAENTESEALLTLSTLKQAITRFFAEVMVMTEVEQLRRNRLALLFAIAQDLKTFADFTKLVI